MRLFFLFVVLLLTVAGAPRVSGQDQSTPIQKVGPKIRPPVPVNSPEADFPREARRNKLPGFCVVSVIVDESGNVVDPKIVRCTDPMFEKNSLDAVRQYRFKPARTVDGDKPVAVKIIVEIKFSFGDDPGNLPARMSWGFASPPDANSLDPDAEGIYPLSKRMAPPEMKKFVDMAFSKTAAAYPEGTGCTVLLVLDAKGKPQSVQMESCDKPGLAPPVVESLLKSKFKPAKLNGKAVAVRLTMKLVYEGFGPPPQR